MNHRMVRTQVEGSQVRGHSPENFKVNKFISLFIINEKIVVKQGVSVVLVCKLTLTPYFSLLVHLLNLNARKTSVLVHKSILVVNDNSCEIFHLLRTPFSKLTLLLIQKFSKISVISMLTCPTGNVTTF